MLKNYDIVLVRRVFRLAFFFFFLFALYGRAGFAQTYVTNNGIIMERLSDEDVKEVERLNEESEAEDLRERAAKADQISDDADEEDLEEANAIDDLFGEESEGDSETAITTPTTEIVKVDAKGKPVEFSGDLSAELGGLAWFKPWKDTVPIATFSNTLKFIGRPRNDFYVYGSFLTQFPEMDFGIYELYFDYTILGLVDLSAGKRDIGWGHSRLLHTNLIDYRRAVIDGSKVLNKDARTTDDSKFTLSITVPVLSYGSVNALAQYQSKELEDEIPDYISLDAKVEANVKKFSIALLGKKWAKMDLYSFDPCLGLEVVSTILGPNSNMFAQCLAHISTGSRKLTRARGTLGIYKYFENPIMLGLAFEYQCVWGRDAEDGQKEGFRHLFASEVGWSHFIFSKKWTFGCKWFHDTWGETGGGQYGIVTPGLTIENVLPYLDFKTTAPIYYGAEEKYGLVFEIVLNLKY